jgi:putative membrane protein
MRVVAHAIVTPTMSPWDAAAVGLLIAGGALYALGQLRMHRRGAVVRGFERIAFWSGWLVMFAAVTPPLDNLALQRFSMHMVQHELLMLVGAPLVIAGRPYSTWLWGLPHSTRRRVAAALQRRSIAGFWRTVTAPVSAWLLHGVVVWVWHVPRLYETAVRDESIHALQHAMFVSTSMLFWWGLVHGRYGRAGYGASVFYVFTTVVHTGILGAVFTLNPMPLYSVYVERAPDPLADQQLAGLVMWIPAGIILTLAGLGLFAAWLGEAERRAHVR